MSDIFLYFLSPFVLHFAADKNKHIMKEEYETPGAELVSFFLEKNYDT